MKSITLFFAIVTMAFTFSIARAQDFYSLNESLLAVNNLDKVKRNSLIELDSQQDSIEAIYFMAMATIRQTSSSDPTKIYANNNYVEKFQVLYRKHAKSQKLMYGNQIMVADTRFFKIFYYLGLKYLYQQDYAKAAEWLNLAKFGYSDNPNLNFNFEIGTSYYALKNYDEAMKYFKAALKLKPDHSDALYNIACIYSIMSKPDESIKRLDKAMHLDPKYKDIASKDSDFDNIRKTQQYQQLMSR